MKNQDNKRISTSEAFPLALQHVLAMVVGCVAVPTMLGEVAELGQADTLIMMQASLFCAGIAILIQAFGKKNIGSGLPVIVGSGFAFIPTLMTIAKSGGVSAVFGAQLVGALVGIIVGLGFKKVRFLFPPIVTSAVVITIGISLYKTAVGYMAGGTSSATFGAWQNWVIALITLLAVLFFSQFCKGVLKVASTLLGIIVGYIVAIIFNDMGFPVIDFSQVTKAAIVALPQPLHFGLTFSLSAIVSMSIMFIINSIQDIGQFEATTTGVYDREATPQEISGGVVGNSISSLIGSILGATPNATAGQNVGIVIQTKVTDKLVFILTAGIVIIAAIFPKITALFLTIPLPVLGGATITVFGSIAMTGMRMFSIAGLTPRNFSIAGLAIAMAVGLSQVPGAFAKCPEAVKVLFDGNPIVVVALVAIIMNLVLPKEKA